MNRWSVITLSAALLGGCASTPQSLTARPTAAAAEAAQSSALLDELGRAVIGQRRVLAGGNELGSREVTVVDAYQAASGRPCRRLLLAAGEQRIICLASHGRWILQRRIGLSWPDEAGEAIDPAASSGEPVHPALRSIALHDVLEAGETLWSFSVRTTGSGGHWRSIAAANGVADAEQVRAGTPLRVPRVLTLTRQAPGAAGRP